MPTHLDDDNRLLHNIAYARLDQLHEHGNTALSRRVNLDSCLSNSADRFANEIDVDFRCVPDVRSRQSSN